MVATWPFSSSSIEACNQVSFFSHACPCSAPNPVVTIIFMGGSVCASRSSCLGRGCTDVTSTLLLLFSSLCHAFFAGDLPALALPSAELALRSAELWGLLSVLLPLIDHRLPNDRKERRLLGMENLKRPLMKKGPYVGRHAAMTEQLGSMCDQMKDSVWRAARQG